MPFIQEIPLVIEGISSVTTFAVDLAPIRQKNSRNIDAEVEVTGGNIAVKWGYDANVLASYTINGTTKRLPDGNYHCKKGTVKVLTIPSAVTHISICPKSGETADVGINLGFERA